MSRRPTREHLEFWRQRRQPVPPWAKKIDQGRVDIEHLIEINAEVTPESEHERIRNYKAKSRKMDVGNTVSLLRSMRARNMGDLVVKLAYLASNPSPPASRRRARDAFRWLKKITVCTRCGERLGENFVADFPREWDEMVRAKKEDIRLYCSPECFREEEV